MLDVTEYARDPAHFRLKRDEVTLDGVQHYYVRVEREESKYEALPDLLGRFEVKGVIIYCNTRRKVNWLL